MMLQILIFTGKLPLSGNFPFNKFFMNKYFKGKDTLSRTLIITAGVSLICTVVFLMVGYALPALLTLGIMFGSLYLTVKLN